MTSILCFSKCACVFVKCYVDAVLIYVAYCLSTSPFDRFVLHLHKASFTRRSTSLLLQIDPCAIVGQLDPKQSEWTHAPIRTREECTAERKLVVGEVQVAVTGHRH